MMNERFAQISEKYRGDDNIERSISEDKNHVST
jgi:hypothetical protein